VSQIIWPTHPVSGGVDSTGFLYDAIAANWPKTRINGHLVAMARNHEGIFIISSSGAPQVERAIGHRGPFPTEEAALTYLQLVKD
jgi:hypothetical protein